MSIFSRNIPPGPGSSSDRWRLAIIHNSITASITQYDQTLKYSQGNNQIAHPTLESHVSGTQNSFYASSQEGTSSVKMILT